jgi:membrane glycosyltransferase
VAAPVVSWATSQPKFGKWLWEKNIFCIPEENDQDTHPAPIEEEERLVAAE